MDRHFFNSNSCHLFWSTNDRYLKKPKLNVNEDDNNIQINIFIPILKTKTSGKINLRHDCCLQPLGCPLN